MFILANAYTASVVMRLTTCFAFITGFGVAKHRPVLISWLPSNADARCRTSNFTSYHVPDSAAPVPVATPGLTPENTTTAPSFHPLRLLTGATGFCISYSTLPRRRVGRLPVTWVSHAGVRSIQTHDHRCPRDRFLVALVVAFLRSVAQSDCPTLTLHIPV